MATHRIEIGGEQDAYPVLLGSGIMANGLHDLAKNNRFSKVVVVTNDIVSPLYGDLIKENLEDVTEIVLPDGEKHKTLDSIRMIYDGLLTLGADRNSAIVALGGGVIGDMAGFAAATYMRGITLIQCPTTLLAMVDASIGGKTGVDLPQGKNLVGAFKDPVAVIADMSTLQTLPNIEITCGMAEVIKAGLIGDPMLVDILSTLSTYSHQDIVRRAIDVKANIVQMDRTEKGKRALLNLGHTFGHALELVSGFRWKHGHAVGWGMAAAVRLSERIGLCQAELITQVEGLLERHNLPTKQIEYDPVDIVEAMRHDKKWRSGRTNFVLLKDIGHCLTVQDVSLHTVAEVIEEISA